MPVRPALVLGHVTPGFGNLGISLWFVVYGMVVVLGLTVLAVRAQPAAPDDERDEGPEATTRTTPTAFAKVATAAAQAVGIALFVSVLLAALIGDPARGSNPAPLTIWVAFFLAVPVLSLVFGGFWPAFEPFSTIAQGLDRLRHRSPAAADAGGGTAGDWWVPAVLLLSFEGWWLAIVDGDQPRGMAIWLIAYAVVMVAGGVVGGAAWCRRNDPFGVVFALFASLSPVALVGGRPAWRRPLVRLSTQPGDRRAAAVMAVLVGAIAFNHAATTTWWLMRLGNLDDLQFSAIGLVGLAWCAILAGVAWAAAARVAAARAQPAAALADDEEDDGDEVPSGGELTDALSPALVPLTAGLFIAYAIPRLMIDLQNVAVLVSDPFGRGWNLFGTLDLPLNEQPITPGTAGWLQVGLIGIGALATVVVVERRLATALGDRARLGSVPVLAFVLVLTLGGMRLVLGA